MKRYILRLFEKDSSQTHTHDTIALVLRCNWKVETAFNLSVEYSKYT